MPKQLSACLILLIVFAICFVAMKVWDVPPRSWDLNSATRARALASYTKEIAERRGIDAGRLTADEWHRLLVDAGVADTAPSTTPVWPWHDAYGSPFQWVTGPRIPGGWAIVSLGLDGVPGGAPCDDLVVTGVILNTGSGESVFQGLVQPVKTIGRTSMIIGGAIVLFTLLRMRQSILLIIGAWLLIAGLRVFASPSIQVMGPNSRVLVDACFALFAASLALPFCWVIGTRWRARSARLRGRCVCGYDVSGLASSCSRCPECGRLSFGWLMGRGLSTAGGSDHPCH